MYTHTCTHTHTHTHRTFTPGISMYFCPEGLYISSTTSRGVAVSRSYSTLWDVRAAHTGLMWRHGRLIHSWTWWDSGVQQQQHDVTHLHALNGREGFEVNYVFSVWGFVIFMVYNYLSVQPKGFWDLIFFVWTRTTLNLPDVWWSTSSCGGDHVISWTSRGLENSCELNSSVTSHTFRF